VLSIRFSDHVKTMYSQFRKLASIYGAKYVQVCCNIIIKCYATS